MAMRNLFDSLTLTPALVSVDFAAQCRAQDCVVRASSFLLCGFLLRFVEPTEQSLQWKARRKPTYMHPCYTCKRGMCAIH